VQPGSPLVRLHGVTAPASIVGASRLTWRIYRDIFRHMLRHARRLLIGLSATLLALGILLLGVYVALGDQLVGDRLVSDGFPLGPAWLAVAAGLLGVVVIDLLTWWTWRSATATGGLDERYTVTPDHVEIENRRGSTRLLATAVTRVHTAPDFWLLSISAFNAVGICRDAFTPADAAAVDAMLAGYGPRRTA
jgi:Na+/proline symporter